MKNISFKTGTSLWKKSILIFWFFMGVFSILWILTLLTPCSGAQMELPDIQEESQTTLLEAIHRLHYTQTLHSHNVRLQEIAQLLWACQGITHSPGFKAVPSAGATHPVEIYIIHKGNSDLEKGIYHYVSSNHTLELIQTDVNESLYQAPVEESQSQLLEQSNTIFIITADYSRTTSKYGNRGNQYVALEVGHIIQNFFLSLVSLDLNSHPITYFNEQTVKAAISTGHDPLVLLPLGLGEDNKTQEELDTNNQLNTISLEQCIIRRKSIRSYIEGQIPRETVTSIIRNSLNISTLQCSQNDIRCHIFSGGIEGMEDGIYLYDIARDQWELKERGDQREHLRSIAIDQQMVEYAQLDIVLSINTEAIEYQTFKDASYRTLMYNLGMIGQNLYLLCTAYGLGNLVVGAFDDDALNQRLENPPSFKPIYIVPIGITSAYYGKDDPDFGISTAGSWQNQGDPQN
jgi:SagB-type dehydrogenase family enzyme